MKKTLLACMIALCTAALGAFGVSADLKSVEMDIVVRTDGKADFYEGLDWHAAGGEMHGFYFQGAAVTPVFNQQQCYADLGNKKRIGLDIKDLGDGKYDVVLAGGQGFTGEAMYFLAYGGDLAASGLIGWTKSADYGELFYFDLAPEEWDQPLGHRTLRITLPVTVAGEKVGADALNLLGFRTEPYVNKENSIDAYGTKGNDGSYYLTIRFNQENVANRQSERIQFYLKKSAVPMQAGALLQSIPQGSGNTGSPESPEIQAAPRAQLSLPAMGAVFAVILAAILLLYIAKVRGFGKTMEKVEGIRWAGDNWIPPKLYGGTYEVKGKIVKDLHPVEVALLLEMPLQRVVAIMLEGLKRQGVIEVVSEDPLRIKILTARKAEHEYEELFLQSFDTRGDVLSGLLADFFEKVLAKLQEKIWDADIDATKEYYRSQLERREETEQDKAAPYYWYWSSYRWIYWNTAVYSQVHLPHDFSADYRTFMASASCFKGCFAPPRQPPAAWVRAIRPATTPAIPPAIMPATQRAIPPVTQRAIPPACREEPIEASRKSPPWHRRQRC